MDEKMADILTDDTAISLETPELKGKYRKYWLGLGVFLVLATILSLFMTGEIFTTLTAKLSEDNKKYY